MKHQEQAGVQDDQAPYDTMSRLLNLLSAGSLDRKAVHRMRASSIADVRDATERLAASKASADAALDEFQAYKASVFDDKVKPFVNAYALIDAEGASEFRLACGASTLPAGVSPHAQPPALASGRARIAAGFILGGAIGGFAAYGIAAAGLVSGGAAPAVLVAMCVVPGLFSAMGAGCRLAARMRSAERRIVESSRQYLSDVEQQVCKLDRIPADIAAMKAHIESLSQKLSTAEETLLDPVLEDGSNACKLLTDILDTALLDGEGALMADVIEKLQRQRMQVQGMQDKLAA